MSMFYWTTLTRLVWWLALHNKPSLTFLPVNPTSAFVLDEYASLAGGPVFPSSVRTRAQACERCTTIVGVVHLAFCISFPVVFVLYWISALRCVRVRQRLPITLLFTLVAKYFVQSARCDCCFVYSNTVLFGCSS